MTRKEEYVINHKLNVAQVFVKIILFAVRGGGLHKM